MPNYQCPECGRFLKHGLVASLNGTSRVRCPGCAHQLTAEMFMDAETAPNESTAPRETPDVLAGWDGDSSATPSNDDRPPFPDDAVIVGAAAAAGALLGAVSARRKLVGAVFGALAGAAVAGASREIWRLDGPSGEAGSWRAMLDHEALRPVGESLRSAGERLRPVGDSLKSTGERLRSVGDTLRSAGEAS